MVGGTDEAFALGEPILAKMGRRIVHCGAAGNGQAAKICNNMILGISMIGVSEAFVLAEKLGLSHQALFDVASTSSGQCWSLTTYCPVPGPVPTSPANNDYKAGFRLGADAEGPEAVAGGRAGGRAPATPLGAAAAQLYGLHNAWADGARGFLRHHQHAARAQRLVKVMPPGARRSLGRTLDTQPAYPSDDPGRAA